MTAKLILALTLLSNLGTILAQTPPHEVLRKAYPESITAATPTQITFQNGTKLSVAGSAKAEDALVRLLADKNADPKAFSIGDMFVMAYPKPRTPIPTEAKPPKRDFDPGRVRSTAFFDAMYGSTEEAVTRNMVSIPWVTSFTLEGKEVSKLRVTKVNGVDKKLSVVRDLLLALPEKRKSELRGIVFEVDGFSGYAKRKISGASFPSPHSWGIAVDVNWDTSYYHRDSKKPYANNVPQDVVDLFESQGFIWGGRWSHFDSMHFEYRPELLR